MNLKKKKKSMKLADKPDKLERDAAKQLKKFYKTYEELLSCSMTWMGALQLVMDFIVENYKDPNVLPERAQYGMALGMYHYRILGKIIRGEVKPEEFSMKFLPITDTAWENATELNERMVLIVKQLYKGLEEDGLL